MSSNRGSATKKSIFKNPVFWYALAVILATILLMVLVNLNRLNFIYSTIAPWTVVHWVGWLGAGFIAVYTPIYYYMKRRSPTNLRTLLRIHVYGNLLAFMFISIHFAEHVRRYIQVSPFFGSGLPLYTAVVLLVATGLMQRLQLVRSWMKSERFVHVSMALAFYLIVVFHVLRNLRIL